MARAVGVNERGDRVGQDHPKAVLTDAQVLLLLELRAAEGWSYRQLAAKFEISRASVRDLIKGRRRVQLPAAYRVVCVL